MQAKYNLYSIESAIKLSNLCAKYSRYSNIGVISGRYVVCGASLLGVESLIGNIVTVKFLDSDDKNEEDFFKELHELTVL